MHEDERPGLGTHMAEDASDVFEQAKNAAVVQRLRNVLDLVNRALHKIDKGTYGPCEHCGQAIDPARLKALPYCALCMPCQAHAEQANRSR
jgi:RNA polymerase-binding transcription factor DksA